MSRWSQSQSQTRQSTSTNNRGYGQRGNNSWRGDRGRASNRGRTMENIASVSRSSGLEKDGDALKDFKIQEEYRQFIQGKLDDLWRQFPEGRPTNDFGAQRRAELQENILILFRKLREGLVSSKRYDSFSLEVYETSLYLSVVFRNTKQSSSIIPHLLPELYEKIPGPHNDLLSTVLISLVHELFVAHPSYGAFQRTLNSVVRGSHLQKSSPAYAWITHLSSSLRSNNYCKFEELTRRESVIGALQNGLEQPPTQSNQDLVQKAMFSLISQLRSKCRDLTWTIMRSAYRELACHEESDTRGWLIRSLALQSVDTSKDSQLENDLLDKWLEEKSTAGHVQRKEGIQNRWLVAKVR